MTTPRIRQRQTSGHENWGTPAYILEAARAALGGPIDLDPASNLLANERVGAAKIYTVADNGLLRPWHAERLWLNPPYTAKAMAAFVNKLATELQAGHVKRACVITNSATETRWAQVLASVSSAICLLSGRVRFELMTADGAAYVPNTQTGMQGQVVWYIDAADYPEPFCRAFKPLGQCFRR